MAPKKSLNATNLEALGTPRLAQLLLDLTKGNAAAKRQLRLELAAETGTADVVREIRKRLNTIARSRAFVDWQKRKALISDLDAQVQTIRRHVAEHDPKEAFDLMWRFLSLANDIYERCDDSSGQVQELFHAASDYLVDLAKTAQLDPIHLADQIVDALPADHYGHFPPLIPGLSEVLGLEGLAHIKSRLTSENQGTLEGYTLKHALQKLADAMGDVDSYVAQQSSQSQSVPSVAADIAARLVKAGRAEDALMALDSADLTSRSWVPVEWELTRIATLEALDQPKDAQAFRLSCFEATLNTDHLRAHLKSLPGFEDVDAEDHALNHALGFDDFNTALHFLVTWPALKHAAKLVVDRSGEIDGNHYELLTPAARTLESRHPLAATLLRRGLIDFALGKGRSKRYRHAARHLIECESDAARIGDFGPFGRHEAYILSLRAAHGKKSSFWSEVAILGANI